MLKLNEIKPRRGLQWQRQRAELQETSEKHEFFWSFTLKTKERKPFHTSPGRPGARFGKGSARGTILPDSTLIIPVACTAKYLEGENSARQVRHELHPLRRADAFYTGPIMHCASWCGHFCLFSKFVMEGWQNTNIFLKDCGYLCLHFVFVKGKFCIFPRFIVYESYKVWRPCWILIGRVKRLTLRPFEGYLNLLNVYLSTHIYVYKPLFMDISIKRQRTLLF